MKWGGRERRREAKGEGGRERKRRLLRGTNYDKRQGEERRQKEVRRREKNWTEAEECHEKCQKVERGSRSERKRRREKVVERNSITTKEKEKSQRRKGGRENNWVEGGDYHEKYQKVGCISSHRELKDTKGEYKERKKLDRGRRVS